MDKENAVSAECPFASKYAEVLGSKMHYIESGEGDPIVFIHGIPTSSYLWRNIIPYLNDYGRCIALDLIGCGKSDKLKSVAYTLDDHIRYVEAFIKNLNLQKITLVVHGWGSVIGLDYAAKYPENIRAIAFYESHIRPTMDWEMVSLPIQQLISAVQAPDGGYDKIVNSDYFIDTVFQSGILRKLSTDELTQYKEAFSTAESRQLIWQYLKELPLGKDFLATHVGSQGQATINRIANYSESLQHFEQPKLMLFGIPGFLTTMETIMWAKQHLTNLTLADLGECLHYAQETKPELFGHDLKKWYLAKVR
jgi:haloalkane dehalogenase